MSQPVTSWQEEKNSAAILQISDGCPNIDLVLQDGQTLSVPMYILKSGS